MRRADSCPTLAMEAEVTHIVDLCPTLRRITLGGPELAHFGVDGPTLDLRFKLVVPHLGADADSVLACLDDVRPHAPAGEDHGWYREWLAKPEHERGAMRTYTARDLRQGPDGTELDVDVVLHLDRRDGELVGGPATLWAATAAPGDTVALIGPNRAVCGADYAGIEWRPGHARRVLLAGDETAVPAIAGILATLADAPGADEWNGAALMEVPSAADVLDLSLPAGVDVRWLVRDGAPRGAQLAAAVAEAAPPAHRLPARPVEDIDLDQTILWETGESREAERYAWVAGESGMLKQLRRYLLGPAGYERDHVAIMGYWREGRPG